MRISTSEQNPAVPLPVSNKERLSTSRPTPEATSSGAAPASPVSISGKAFVMARLFEGHVLEPAVVHYAPGLDSMFPTYFLTQGDRELLGSVYEFAQGEGIDLAYVDDLAGGIAHYRRADNGKEVLPQRPLMRFDMEGHEVTYTFNEKAAATANRIMAGEGIKSTGFDKGFLRFALDVAYSPMSTLNFDFLEQVVNRFSDVGATVTDLGNRFSHFQRGEKNYIKHVSKEVYDICTSRRIANGSKTDIGKASQKPDPLGYVNIPQDLSTTLRQVIQKYLQKSGIPTLFDMIARLRR
jgi:hypothetical protein